MLAQELPWSPNRGIVVTTVFAQWTLLVGQRRHNSGTIKVGGRSITQIDVYTRYAFLRVDQWPTPVHPSYDQGDGCAFLLPPLSDLWVTDLLGDLCATGFEHAQNFTATMASMARSARPLCRHWTAKATVRPPLPSTATWLVLWSHKGSTTGTALV